MKKNKNTEDRLKIIDDKRKKAPGVVIIGHKRKKGPHLYNDKTAKAISKASGF